jgi:hypothetical protein
MRNFFTAEVREPQDRVLRAIIGRAEVQRRDADHPLRRGKLEHRFLHGRIMDRGGGIRLVAEQHRRGEHAETRIDADKKVDRSDIALDIAELDAFDLARDRAELARWIDLDLDAAIRGFLDLVLVEFDELVLGLVDRGSAELHYKIRGRRGTRAKKRAKSAGEGGDRNRGSSEGRRHIGPYGGHGGYPPCCAAAF